MESITKQKTSKINLLLCPEGIDVYFDNVAGPILDAVLFNIAVHGRVALSGMMENYNKEEPVPGPYQFDMLLMRRAISQDFYPEIFTVWKNPTARCANG